MVVAADPDELWQRVETNVEWIEPRAQLLATGEADRTRALDAKANQVLAVAALATSIAATALAPRLEDAETAASITGLVAAASVLLAAVLSVWALFPRSFSSFATAELEEWPTGDFLSSRPRDVQGRVLNGWLRMIARARLLNERKARLVRAALVALVIALAFTTVTAGIIAT